MSLSAAEIIEVMQKAKDLGIKQVKTAGLELNLESEDAKTIAQFVPDAKAEELLKPWSPTDQYTEEEILFYHSAYFDELQAKKAEHQKKIDDEHSKGLEP